MYLGGAYFYACAPSKLRRVRQLVPGDAIAATTLVIGMTGRQRGESDSRFTAGLVVKRLGFPEIRSSFFGSEYFRGCG